MGRCHQPTCRTSPISWPHPRVQYTFGPSRHKTCSAGCRTGTLSFSERVTACRGMWDTQPKTEGPSGGDLTLLFIESQPVPGTSLCFRCLLSSSLHKLCEVALLLPSFTVRKPRPRYGLRSYSTQPCRQPLSINRSHPAGQSLP